MAYVSETRDSKLNLDGPPPRPPLKSKPGEDTFSLLGPSQGGGSLPLNAVGGRGRALAGVAMLLQGAQMVLAELPAAMPPELLSAIESLTQAVPMMLEQQGQNGGMMNLLMSQLPGNMGQQAPMQPSAIASGQSPAPMPADMPTGPQY